MIVIDDIEQGSDEWRKMRSSIPTSSCFDKIITSKGEPSKQSKAYLNTLVAEHIIGSKLDTFSNHHMDRGGEVEPQARAYYEFQTDTEVQTVGLVFKDESRMVACSPDGLMPDRGLEIKCPAAHTQVEYLIRGKLPAKYVAQVQGSMWITGLTKWDFLSFHPELPSLMLTVEADPEFHDKLDSLIGQFVERLIETRLIVEKL